MWQACNEFFVALPKIHACIYILATAAHMHVTKQVGIRVKSVDQRWSTLVGHYNNFSSNEVEKLQAGELTCMCILLECYVHKQCIFRKLPMIPCIVASTAMPTF